MHIYVNDGVFASLLCESSKSCRKLTITKLVTCKLFLLFYSHLDVNQIIKLPHDVFAKLTNLDLLYVI